MVGSSGVMRLLLALLFAVLFVSLSTQHSSSSLFVMAHDIDDEDVFASGEDEEEEHHHDADGLEIEDEEEEEGYELGEEAEEGELIAHPDVEISYVFRKQQDLPEQQGEDSDKRVFQAGKVITAWLSFVNSGSSSFNVTDVDAYFQSPFDLDYYIQNFTARPVGYVVGPHSRVTLQYMFMADPRLDPVDFWLSGFVNYNDSNDNLFRTTWVNESVTLLAADSEFDPIEAFRYCVPFFFIFAFFYFATVLRENKRGGANKESVREKARPATEEEKQQVAASWEVDAFTPGQAKSVGKKRINSKNKKKHK